MSKQPTLTKADLIEEAERFLEFASNYLLSSGKQIKPGETMAYGYWLVKFQGTEQGSHLEAWEYSADASTFVLTPDDQPFPYRAGQYCTFRVTVDGEEGFSSKELRKHPHGFGYIVTALAVGVVIRIYLMRDLWQRVAQSVTVQNLSAADNVTAQGELVSALGEGLAKNPVGSSNVGFGQWTYCNFCGHGWLKLVANDC